MNTIPNKNYGSGMFRRKILFLPLSDHLARVALEDDCHAVRIDVKHDGRSVIGVDANWHRHPTTACTGAIEAIRTLEGCPLTDNLLEITKSADPKLNCTHIFDIVALAITHITRRERRREYEITVPDTLAGAININFSVDGGLHQSWVIDDGKITSPPLMEERQIFGGLLRWAAESLSDSDFDAVFMIQHALFVAQSRRFNLNAMAGDKPFYLKNMAGSCYAHQPEGIGRLVTLPSQVDFSAEPDDMLAFLREGDSG